MPVPAAQATEADPTEAQASEAEAAEGARGQKEGRPEWRGRPNLAPTPLPVQTYHCHTSLESTMIPPIPPDRLGLSTALETRCAKDFDPAPQHNRREGSGSFRSFRGLRADPFGKP